MTNVNTKPVVATSNPQLYANHTFHMSRATPFTYNYAVVDDYILANYMTKSQRQMAKDLNEYPNRIAYRVQVLKANGIISVKAVGRTTEGRLKKEYLQQYDAAIKLYKELMAINPQALAG